MNIRALPAAEYLTALGAQPISTGHLLADCERWCRDRLPRQWAPSRPSTRALTSTGALHQR